MMILQQTVYSAEYERLSRGVVSLARVPATQKDRRSRKNILSPQLPCRKGFVSTVRQVIHNLHILALDIHGHYVLMPQARGSD